MESIFKDKKFFIVILIILTIVGIIVYNLLQNQEKEDYFFDEIEKNDNEIIEKTNTIKVHISGEVVSPGVIELEQGTRIIDAINEAGGLNEEADINKINLAYVLEDAMKIYIPNINDEEKKDIFILTSEENNKDEIVRVNINTATEEELQKVSGIGAATAAKIIAYRKRNGKFKSIEELKNVGGIGESKFENIKDYIYVK